jgi:hypothetical protein
MTRNSVSVRTHFHIHWSGKDSWDWECFDSILEAMARAAELAGPGETFTIEDASTDCLVCSPRVVWAN